MSNRRHDKNHQDQPDGSNRKPHDKDLISQHLNHGFHRFLVHDGHLVALRKTHFLRDTLPRSFIGDEQVDIGGHRRTHVSAEAFQTNRPLLTSAALELARKCDSFPRQGFPPTAKNYSLK